jgi:hypothetical protein
LLYRMNHLIQKSSIDGIATARPGFNADVTLDTCMVDRLQVPITIHPNAWLSS